MNYVPAGQVIETREFPTGTKIVLCGKTWADAIITLPGE